PQQNQGTTSMCSARKDFTEKPVATCGDVAPAGRKASL
ncbi:unnamed protein product, partial [marine sediment metagenome]